MAKTLCDWKRKEIERDFEELCALLAEPRFVCRKCARCAGKSAVLCKPRAIGKGRGRKKGEGEGH